MSQDPYYNAHHTFSYPQGQLQHASDGQYINPAVTQVAANQVPMGSQVQADQAVLVQCARPYASMLNSNLGVNGGGGGAVPPETTFTSASHLGAIGSSHRAPPAHHPGNVGSSQDAAAAAGDGVIAPAQVAGIPAQTRPVDKESSECIDRPTFSDSVNPFEWLRAYFGHPPGYHSRVTSNEGTSPIDTCTLSPTKEAADLEKVENDRTRPVQTPNKHNFKRKAVTCLHLPRLSSTVYVLALGENSHL